MTHAGQRYYEMPQAIRLNNGPRYLSPGAQAPVGVAIAASIGGATASPDRTVVVVIGDGSRQTNIQELQTHAHHQLNAKLFVIDNGGCAAIRKMQRVFFNGHFVGSNPDCGVTLREMAPDEGVDFPVMLASVPDYSSSNPALEMLGG